MYTGSCLCKGIMFEIHQAIEHIFVCHCVECQKAQGSAFVAVVTIEKDQFKMVKGKEKLTEYYSSPLKRRVFCQTCGSPIFSARDDLPEVYRLRAGLIDQKLHAQIYSHAYLSECVSWMNFDVQNTLAFQYAVTHK